MKQQVLAARGNQARFSGRTRCAGRINTRVYAAYSGGRLLRKPGQRCSLNATCCDGFCRHHCPSRHLHRKVRA